MVETNLSFIHQKAVERASDEDRAWFERNPARHMRLRDTIPMDFNGPLPELPEGYTHRTITVRLTDVVRSRCPIGLVSISETRRRARFRLPPIYAAAGRTGTTAENWGLDSIGFGLP